jgi:superfamily II RNA helicase
MEALSLVEGSDVLVCAPTGAGKTWIAVEAMARRLEMGQRAWYATPLKALSNAKYEEFKGRFGSSAVGILTGDRKENPEAPLVVGTTEILRNHLYDAMDRGTDLNVDVVVLDEAHYLGDEERGVVWEEVLIYLPPRVRILMLSATVGNPQEICAWLESIRGQPCRLVQAQDRPVPLFPIFLFPDGQVGLLMGRRGLLKPVRRYLREMEGGRRRDRAPRWTFPELVEGLGDMGLLPAIFFLKSRADCDRAVETYKGRPRPLGEQRRMRSLVETLVEEFPVLRDHRQMAPLVRYGVASHHAGQLPQWKLVVERLMNQGMLSAIFSTSTVAAGVDFPARTVVIPQSDRFNGREFAELTSTELLQMTGRAGRRGKDRVGFALFIPGPHQDLSAISRRIQDRPDGIQSRIQINFSMVLNLLLSHRPEEVKPLLQRSLAAFQQGWGEGDGSSSAPLRTARGARTSAPARAFPPSRVAGRSDRELLWRLGRGRLFLHKDGSIYVAFHLSERRGRPLCMAHRLDRRIRYRKGRLVLKGIPLREIKALLEWRVPIPEEAGREDLEALLKELRESMEAERVPAETDLEGPPPEADGPGLWKEFLRHLRFLQQTGFVDPEGRLTPDGRWASRLRLEHPILVAEAIRRGVFADRTAAVLAGLMAPFVTDREREVLFLGWGLEEMGDAFDALLAATRGIRARMEQWGFPTPILQFWTSGALFLWARGSSWTRLREAVPLDEGDLVSLITRTADHLRQVCDLLETHPQVASTARKAIALIQRPPVYEEQGGL